MKGLISREEVSVMEIYEDLKVCGVLARVQKGFVSILGMV